MGKALERALWRMYAPHKVKLAVSGCPRNCAESGIKDVGVIGVDSGWEIYVAGNGGIKTEVAQFLVKVKTSRRGARVRGRVPAALSRGGLVSRAHRALRRARRPRLRQEARSSTTREGRRALWERLQFALDGEPDPWHEPERAQHRSRASSTPLGAGMSAQPSRRVDARGARSRRRPSCAVCRARRHPGARRARAGERPAHADGDIARVPHRRRSRVRPARPLSRTRAARCRRASCSAIASRARCTTGRSSSRAAARSRPTRAARATFRGARRRRHRCTSRRATRALTAAWRRARPARTAASAAASSSSTTAHAITGVRGDPDHPANRGAAVHQGPHAAPDRRARGAGVARARIRSCARRRARRSSARHGTRRSTTLADRFAACIREHGPDSVAFYISGQLLTEDYYVFNKLAKGLDRHQQRRHQLAAVHVERGRRLQGDARRRRAAGVLRRHRSRATACSSPARTRRGRIRSCSAASKRRRRAIPR